MVEVRFMFYVVVSLMTWGKLLDMNNNIPLITLVLQSQCCEPPISQFDTVLSTGPDLFRPVIFSLLHHLGLQGLAHEFCSNISIET